MTKEARNPNSKIGVRRTGLVLLAVMLGAGCTTPYLERVNGLTEAYERGDLSREDYMRFVHDAERWERK